MLETYRNNTPDHITTGKMQIRLKDTAPVAYHPRRLAYEERRQVKQIVSKLLQDGIIRESHSDYASPIVLVKKKNGELRMCVDYRDVNKRVFKERYPLPHIQDQINSLCYAKFFTTLDMKSGFYQMEIEEESKHITAFITPDGHYEFNRMPFGYVNAPSIYQRAIDKALGDLKGSKAFVYLDDVLVPSTTIEEGLDTLQEVLCALTAGGFSLNYEKCVFFATETEYLGVVLSEGTIKPSPRKVKALTETPVPSNIKSVRQFMGLAGYFRRFIQGFSKITAPITALLRKDQVFNWTPECESARQLIISKLTEPPILRIYNPELPCQLHTDASSVGIGAALLQVENGAAYPVAYYSRRTTDYESRYPAYDLETLAIVEAVEHFRVYLYGVHFTVFTDCNSVRATALKKNLHRRVAHWWMKLQDFDFSIEYRPGKQMAHVDYLSRNPVDEESDLKVCVLKTISANKISDVQTLREFQNNDSFCREILNDPDCSQDFTVINNVVVTKTKPQKCFVPIAARLLAMKLYHDYSSHIGWDKCIQKMREDLFWPKMGQCLKKYIKNCRSCVLGKSHTGPRSGLWQHGEQPSDILETWHIDHAGPIMKSNGCTQILVIIDAFSKYCRLQPIPKKTSEDSICALLAVFEELGRPKRIIADRGTAFTSTMFQNFLSEQGVKLHHIATGIPRGNGKVERLMRTVFNLLRATLTAKKENTWTVAIAAIEDNLNSTVHSATGYVPAVLQLGINPRLVATQQFLGDAPTSDHFVDPDKAVADARVRMQENTKKHAQRFDATRFRSSLFLEGDKVAVEDSQLAGGGKLKAKYKGPYTVSKRLPNERYLLTKKGQRTTVAAHEQLRSWPSTETSD
ncbi:Retrovirus-related Pol polyprotein from transposon 297-like Protein [Tribolium castaneum]|uniref:RNA-directed DNA polymerase n=1 Tax=Tribolium castaneum TaxID=7070 RepID=D2A5M1_TRICA|nr:Retrovirus-related Pol polyprotein from transposon 297-like Protein [Tribolium castaneum]